MDPTAYRHTQDLRVSRNVDFCLVIMAILLVLGGLALYEYLSMLSRVGSLALTHLPMDKMAAISQMIFSDTFLWMELFYFD